MLLLYHCSRSFLRSLSRYLHSTMLLLYRNQIWKSKFVFNNLHSTMLLLYHNGMQTIKTDESFTFHYASTLSKTSIQLCLCPDNLHSTMLLLYHTIGWAVQGVYTIYIPLCFYFIGSYDIYNVPTDRIYIPLCFYFIPFRFLHVEVIFVIYIPLCFYFIQFPVCDCTCQIDLHSTMLLLYLPFFAVSRFVAFIYIPLCFYFIPE